MAMDALIVYAINGNHLFFAKECGKDEPTFPRSLRAFTILDMFLLVPETLPVPFRMRTGDEKSLPVVGASDTFFFAGY